MLDQFTLRGRIISAALRLAAGRPWAEVSLLDIAEEAGATLMELKDLFASKAEVLTGFVREVDEEMIRRAPKRMAGAASRDTLFEVIMSRFDVLQPHKPALRSIVAAPSFDPALVQSLFTSQRWTLHASGVVAEGVRGALRVAGLASIYASVFRVWLEDDDPGLARTMAALDRRLRRGERTLSMVDEACAAVARIGGALRRQPSAGQASRRSTPSSTPDSQL
jgi:ubiquinone biosynthesis protein COQ9